MGDRGKACPALAIIAATAGTACASGRELALFFAQLGWAGWLGIAFAGLTFGLLTGLLCRCAVRMDADSFAALCSRMLGPRTAVVARWMQGILLALAALVMLHGAGRLGELALPLRHGFAWGMAAALLLALTMNLARLRPMPGLGLLLLTAGTAFYVALALDARPVRVYLHGAVELALEGSVSAALLLALVYAAMNACVAAGVAVRFGRKARPGRVGLACGLMLTTVLLCANGAIARGGRTLLFQAMPTVLLAARWGVPGFWLCAILGFFSAVATLSAALGGLADLHC